MEDDIHCKMSSIKNPTFMNVNITSNFFGNINKENSFVGKSNEQKVKSELRQDLFWTFRILIMFFKLIGLATFTHRIVIYKKRTSYTFQYSKLGIVYNVVLSSLMIASNYMSIPYRINDDYYEKTKLTVGIEVLQAVLGTLVICAILISYCIDQKFLVRIANRLIIIEHEIDRLYDLYYPLRRQRIFYTTIIVCILKICLLILLLCTEILGIQTDPVSWLADVLPTFHVSWLLIQYFLLVTVIQTDFADVNRAIQSLTRINASDRLQSLYQTRRIVINNSAIHQLLQLRDVHCHLCEMSEDVSSFYSLSVLFGIIFFFLTLMYNGYYFLSSLLMTVENLDYGTLNNAIVWIIFLIYPIFLLTNRITKILIEIETTGNIVHDFLNCAIGKETKAEICYSSRNFRFNYYIAKYSLQLTDVFTLDNTFLHSLIGTVAIYLVIFMQFQSLFSSNKQHYNSTGRDLK